jgi:hypothetical protein
MEGEPEVSRSYEFEPLEMLPEWPGNEEARAHDFKAGFEQDDAGVWSKFTEPEPTGGVGELCLPPSFKDFCKAGATWLRPEEYIKEIMYEKEVQRRRQEKKREFKLRKTTRKNSLMALAQHGAGEPEQQKQETELEILNKTKSAVNKDDLVPEPKVIGYEERLETEAEVQKRKEAAEKELPPTRAPRRRPHQPRELRSATQLTTPRLSRFPLMAALT